MSSSPTALHLNKVLESDHNSTFYQDLLKAQMTLDNDEEKLFSNKKTHQKIDLINSSSRTSTAPLSNNAPILDHTSTSVQHDDEKIMTQLFKHLHRPLPEYVRPRQFGTKEWFDIQCKNIY